MDNGILTKSFFKAKYKSRLCIPVLNEEIVYEFDVNKLSCLKIDALTDFLKKVLQKTFIVPHEPSNVCQRETNMDSVSREN